MKDVALLLVTVGFFAIAWLYARACERVWRESADELRIPRRPAVVPAAPGLSGLRPAWAGEVL